MAYAIEPRSVEDQFDGFLEMVSAAAPGAVTVNQYGQLEAAVNDGAKQILSSTNFTGYFLNKFYAPHRATLFNNLPDATKTEINKNTRASLIYIRDHAQQFANIFRTQIGLLQSAPTDLILQKKQELIAIYGTLGIEANEIDITEEIEALNERHESIQILKNRLAWCDAISTNQFIKATEAFRMPNWREEETGIKWNDTPIRKGQVLLAATALVASIVIPFLGKYLLGY